MQDILPAPLMQNCKGYSCAFSTKCLFTGFCHKERCEFLAVPSAFAAYPPLATAYTGPKGPATVHALFTGLKPGASTGSYPNSLENVASPGPRLAPGPHNISPATAGWTFGVIAIAVAVPIAHLWQLLDYSILQLLDYSLPPAAMPLAFRTQSAACNGKTMENAVPRRGPSVFERR